jgi:hypothetical protein
MAELLGATGNKTVTLLFAKYGGLALLLHRDCVADGFLGQPELFLCEPSRFPEIICRMQRRVQICGDVTGAQAPRDVARLGPNVPFE